MQSNILDSLGFDPGILMIAMMLIMVFVLVYMVRVSMKLTRFLKRYRIFMRGKDAVSLEKAFAQKKPDRAPAVSVIFMSVGAFMVLLSLGVGYLIAYC